MLQKLVESAFEYAFPLYAVAQTRYRAVQDPSSVARHAPNTVRHEQQLSDHTSRWITSPNNDTLYSNAWLDLSQGPVRVRVGEMQPGRYWSLAFMDAFTNHFAVVGQRLDGSGPVALTLIGPGASDAGLPGRVIRAPGHDAWLFARCLVDGPEDLPHSHAMQARIEVSGPPGSAYPPRVVPTSFRDPRNFIAVVNEGLARNPVPASELSLLEGFAAAGLRAGAVDAWNSLSEEAREAWTRGIDAAHQRLRQASKTGRREIQGWFASAPEMGDFGTKHALRASVALGGLGALIADEAMYFVRFHDDAQQPLDGHQRYLLRIPPGGIPTDSFWSFSMYEPTADSQRFFVENPIARYSIGNRTRGLVHNADGSLDIAIQHQRPSDPRLLANWLPSPGGSFQIALRTYMPRPELRDGTAPMPTILHA
ncbi:MAG: DUF1254 domain-containing protein [Variovorax sp.]